MRNDWTIPISFKLTLIRCKYALRRVKNKQQLFRLFRATCSFVNYGVFTDDSYFFKYCRIYVDNAELIGYAVAND